MKLTIDGRKIEVQEGTTVLEAAGLLGISIPTLCHHPKLTPFGGCRLCIVEIKGVPQPVTSCTTPAADGMEVFTSTEQLLNMRKTILGLILSDHPNDCMVCEKAGDCELQELVYLHGLSPLRGAEGGVFFGERRSYKDNDENPFIARDMEKCILCGRCVRICEEVQGVGAIDFAYKGFKSKVCPPYERSLDCEFCGQCVSVCPTGALTGKQWARKGRTKNVRKTDTVCAYCGTGCNITLHVRDNEVIKVTSAEDNLNEGLLCVKGRFGYKFINSPERLKKPLIRIVPKGEPSNGKNAFREAEWEEAFDLISSRLKHIKAKYGPDSIGGLSSARCTNEENYLFQKLIRAAVGTNNVDHCARL